jgi:hypothetical protein
MTTEMSTAVISIEPDGLLRLPGFRRVADRWTMSFQGDLDSVMPIVTNTNGHEG